jgi:hypothetical protein
VNWFNRVFRKGQVDDVVRPSAPVETSKAAFFDVLKRDFFPRLRAAGFRGSGQHFCRVRGDVMHAVNLQNRREGGSCAVNLGVHLTFLPLVGGRDLPAPNQIKEVNCEIRRRLSGTRKSDQWWSHAGAERSAADLADVYFSTGEPWFEQLSSVTAIAAQFDYRRMIEGDFGLLPAIVPARAALVGARIHAHLSNCEQSRRLAAWGLRIVGRASALQEELQNLARGT